MVRDVSTPVLAFACCAGPFQLSPASGGDNFHVGHLLTYQSADKDE